MNKNKLSLFLFLFSFLLFQNPIFGQNALPIWYSDDFSNPESGFTHNTETKNGTYNYKDGKYVIKNHAPDDRCYRGTRTIYTDSNKEMMFEVKFSLQEAETEDAGHGFCIRGKDEKTYFFMIKPQKGSFIVKHLQKEDYRDATIEQTFNFIKKGLKEVNKMTIHVTGNKIVVKVNDQEVYWTSNLYDYTGLYGFFASKHQLLHVDDFIFYHDVKLNLVPNAPTNVIKENLGDKVNTKYSETSPRITPDGKYLYYSIHNSPENTGGEKDGTDVWFSESIDGGETWQQKRNIGKPINNSTSNFVISVTPDNNTLLLGNTYNTDGSAKGGGISITHRTVNGWEIPEELEIEDMSKFLNDTKYVSYCLSNDRKTLIISLVYNALGFGGSDLYVSFNLGGNNWSRPKHMGNNINTKNDDTTPFLAADGVSLYFSSDGFPGYGDNDIFVTRRLDDTWTKWSEPQNLGKGINSTGWDAYFTIPASGKYAYMTTTKGGIEKSLDIVRIKLAESIKPKPVVLISGKVFNSKTKEPMSASITYNAIKAGKELGIATSNPTDGSYKIVLPAGEFYGFLAQKNNFISVSENIDVTKITAYKEITRDLYLAPIESGQTIRLNNVFFDFSKASLRGESFGDLDRLIQTLNSSSDMKIEIGGHTDNVGDAQNNLTLSQSRANAVLEYLASKGISKTRLIAKGYGMTKPTANNTTEEGRQMNRRVEITILSK